MKKKLLAALLCAAMTFSLAGCGEDEKTPANNSSSAKQSSKTENSSEQQSSDISDNSESAPESTSEESGSSDEIQLPDKVKDATPHAVENIMYTGWTLSGGLVNDVELDDAAMTEVLSAFGGHYNIIFNAGGHATVVIGGEGTEVDYELSSDNTMVTLKNGDAIMAGVFTMNDGVLTMMLVNQSQPYMAYYFTYMDEK